ncbi:MAG TPA: hypothetical protein VFS21_18030 [Roseiflexaceae bacterium]|nr:hypothetical protein [Roseiflexaceae bacterium]
MDERRRSTLEIAGFCILLVVLFAVGLAVIWSLPAPETSASSAVPTVLIFEPIPAPTAEPTPEPPCREQAKPLVEQLDALLVEWDAQRAIIGTLPSDQLESQIGVLQALRVNVLKIVPPPCAAALQQTVADGMEQAIGAYRGFVDQQPEEDFRTQLAQADLLIASYRETVAKVVNAEK